MVETMRQTAVGALFLYAVGIIIFGCILEYYFSLMWECDFWVLLEFFLCDLEAVNVGN